MCYTHIWSNDPGPVYPPLPSPPSPHGGTDRGRRHHEGNVVRQRPILLHMIMHYTHIWSYEHALCPYMVIWACIIPIYGHMIMVPPIPLSWFDKGRDGSIKGWIPFSADGTNLRNTAEKYVPFGSDGTRLQWLEQHADAYSLVISAKGPTDYEGAFAAFELLREFAAAQKWLDFEALALVGFMLMAWRRQEDEVKWPARCSALPGGE